MLKACSKCGKVHNYGECMYTAKLKRKDKKRLTEADFFRRSQAWKKKRLEILERDKHMCKVCIAGTHPIGERAINTNEIQIHHIEPIVKAWKKRLDNNNLICLCPYHHYLAEHGDITAEELCILADTSPLLLFEKNRS